MKLIDKGYTREDAYKIVQAKALEALNGANFKDSLLQESILSNEEIIECFNSEDYLKNIDNVFARF